MRTVILKNLRLSVVLLSFMLYGFTSLSCLNFSMATNNHPDILIYNQPTLSISNDFHSYDHVNYILLDQSFVGFKEALAFKESRGRYHVVNTLGYLGKFQFGASTLEIFGVYSSSDFLECPELQEKVFIANLKRNKWILRRDIKRFVGHNIKGTYVTESGILAAAHLAGPGSVKRYLRSNGAIDFKDAYGTNINSYIRQFSAFDTSTVTAERRPKVDLL